MSATHEKYSKQAASKVLIETIYHFQNHISVTSSVYLNYVKRVGSSNSPQVRLGLDSGSRSWSRGGWVVCFTCCVANLLCGESFMWRILWQPVVIGVGKCVGVWGRNGRSGKRYERCRKVCWGVGEVKEDAGKGEVREEMWVSVGERVLGPNTLTNLPTPPPFLSPLANTPLYSPHTFSTPLPTLLHSPDIFPYLPPHPNTLPYTLPHTPNTSSHSSPYTPTCFPTHPIALSTPLPTSSPTVSIMWRSYLNKFNWKNLIKFFTTTGNLKSCFGVDNIIFDV